MVEAAWLVVAKVGEKESPPKTFGGPFIYSSNDLLFRLFSERQVVAVQFRDGVRIKNDLAVGLILTTRCS